MTVKRIRVSCFHYQPSIALSTLALQTEPPIFSHVGSIDGVTWKVWADGNNCDTTAQLNTISGAVQNYLRDSNKEVCGVHCVKLTHGGTWNGYITLAAPGEDLDDFYCGKFQPFGNCGSGGEDDA